MIDIIRTGRGLSVAVAMLIASSAAPAGLTLHVSTTGKDTNPGTPERPLATPGAARDALRAAGKARAGATVLIHGGTYALTAPLELTARDSGTKTAPICYIGAPGRPVHLLGGREIPPGAFAPVTDAAALKRLDASVRTKVVRCDLKGLGITDFGRIRPRGFARAPVAPMELFFNDAPMTPARWPNQGYATIVSVPGGKDGGTFTYSGDRPKRWTKARDLWLFGYWYHDWADMLAKVDSIDTGKRLITLAKPLPGYGLRAKHRWYAVNLLEELDAPGEWYLDRTTGVLTFYPPGPLAGARIVVTMLERPIISLRSVSHVTISRLIVEGGRSSAVSISDCTGVRIESCILRNMGTGGAEVRGGSNSGLAACDIYATGSGGVSLSGGDRAKLTPAGLYAENNHIHHFGRTTRTYAPAVRIGGVGNRMVRNLIHHAPHAAVLYGGNEHEIALNDIHHVCLDTGDVGAIYTGRDWGSRGTVVTHNFIHDLVGVGGWSMGVYLDDCASGQSIVGNVFHRVRRAAFIGGGRDNLVSNNIFVECDPAVHVDSRGTRRITWKAGLSSSWDLQAKIERYKYTTPPWSTRYPRLARIMGEQPALPMGNVIEHNLAWKCGKWLNLSGTEAKVLTVRDNVTDQDPRFGSGLNERFQPAKDSPVWKTGFQRIPTERIGLDENAARKAIPKPQ